MGYFLISTCDIRPPMKSTVGTPFTLDWPSPVASADLRIYYIRTAGHASPRSDPNGLILTQLQLLLSWPTFCQPIRSVATGVRAQPGQREGPRVGESWREGQRRRRERRAVCL